MPRPPTKTTLRLIPLCMAVLVFIGGSVFANPPREDRSENGIRNRTSLPGPTARPRAMKIDRPNVKDFRTLLRREKAIESMRFDPSLSGRRVSAGRPGVRTDRMLVILVEFAGEDTFTFDPAESSWDPYGTIDGAENTGSDFDCGNIVSQHGLTEPTDFAYAGPLHNEIPRPPSADSSLANTIWTEDFSSDWYREMLFGEGVAMTYLRGDGSEVNLDFRGESLRRYYRDMSGGRYDIEGDVIGWIPVPHSIWYYGADSCPGALSGGYASDDFAIPEAGDPRTLVQDIVEKVNELHPDFDWASYDQDGDGVVDRLWIIHAGAGEEDSPELLDLTPYGEGTIWSHSWEVYPYYPADEENEIYVGPYIMMPENGGISVFAHESAHNLGAIDLYDTSGVGETSAGFWSLMADDWVGYPIGFLPPPMDPLHLDQFGWLDPKVLINDPSRTYTVLVGQASSFPDDDEAVRGVQIWLPDGTTDRPVQPIGRFQWWGGNQNDSAASMTTADLLAIPTESETRLQFDLAYDIEEEYDYLYVEVSTDGGETWIDLRRTKEPTVGYTGTGPGWPSYNPDSYSLSPYAGQSILLQFLYLTDSGVTGHGPFIDNVRVTSGAETIFGDDAEGSDDAWVYSEPWERVNGKRTYAHSYYLQWRNVSETGGYDRLMADPEWRYGPANAGLLVWYSNSLYPDNNILNYLSHAPSIGPKGRMLVVDAHPDPYRWPDMVEGGFDNEGGNLSSRGQMRDATFGQPPTPDFLYGTDQVSFPGRPGEELFTDSQGYYPGLEYASPGPGYDPPDLRYWLTRQWDASVVIPARSSYPVDAPSCPGHQAFGYLCHADTDSGRLFCDGEEIVPSGGGGSGRPDEAYAGTGQAYGWNVRVLVQNDTTALLGIWNSEYHPNPVFPPVVRGMDDRVSYIGDSVSVAVEILAPMGELPEIRAEGLPPGLDYNGTTGRIEGTISGGAQGDYSVTVEGTLDGASGQSRFTWTVPNRIPMITHVDAGAVLHRGEGMTLALTVEDQDGDALLFTATGLPPGFRMAPDGSVEGALSLDAPESSYETTVVVSDGLDETSTEILFTVENRAPVLANPGDQTSLHGAFVGLLISGSDADRDGLTFSATDLPEGLSLDPATGWISGTILASTPNPRTVTVILSDGLESDLETFSWMVVYGDAQLATVTDEPAGTNCPEGGRRIDIGRDLNSDGTLQDEEIETTLYACDESDHALLVKIGDEAAGSNCPYGGKKIEFGPDANDDGTLQTEEVTQTRFVCFDLSKPDGDADDEAEGDDPADGDLPEAEGDSPAPDGDAVTCDGTCSNDGCRSTGSSSGFAGFLLFGFGLLLLRRRAVRLG